MQKLKGLIAAPFTPLDHSGELALHQIEKLANLYKRNDVHGAFVCGTTGEGVSLTFEEKRKVMKEWGKIKEKNFKTLFMLGGNCLKEMQELALYAKDCGLDGVSALCPFYFKSSSIDQLVDFCRQVALTVPDLPFYYYHIPTLTGGNFSMIEFLKLADELIPNMAGIKYTHSNLMEYHSCLRFKNRKYDMLWGTDEALLSGLAVGARGAVGSTYNYAAPLYNDIIRNFNDGQIAGAEKLQYKAVQMVELLTKYGGIGAGKAFMKIINVDCGSFRTPIQSLDSSQTESLRIDLEEIDFFDFCSKW